MARPYFSKRQHGPSPVIAARTAVQRWFCQVPATNSIVVTLLSGAAAGSPVGGPRAARWQRRVLTRGGARARRGVARVWPLGTLRPVSHGGSARAPGAAAGTRSTGAAQRAEGISVCQPAGGTPHVPRGGVGAVQPRASAATRLHSGGGNAGAPGGRL